MTDFEIWFVDFEPILAKLASGLDLFGVHAAWLWAIPACWAVTLMLLWIYTSWRQRQSDRAYLAYASRNLSLLRRIARQRADEVAFSRRTDRF